MLQIVFPVIPGGYHGKTKGKRAGQGLGFKKNTHTHAHTQQNGHFSFLKLTSPKQWRKKHTGLHALQLH
jgi:hypothetical protein